MLPADRIADYLSSATPSDQILTDFIRKQMRHLEDIQLMRKFDYEIKEQLNHIYDRPNPIWERIKTRETNEQRQREFNFKNFVSKKLMNQFNSRNSTRIGRLTFSTIGYQLTDFHKPRYNNEFAVFQVSCFDTENPVD